MPCRLEKIRRRRKHRPAGRVRMPPIGKRQFLTLTFDASEEGGRLFFMPDSPENDRFRLCFAEFSTCFVTLWSSAVLFGARSLRYIPNQRNGRDVRRILRVRRSILLCSGAHECAVSRRLLRFSDSSLLSCGRLKGSWREVRRIIGLAAARRVMTDGAREAEPRSFNECFHSNRTHFRGGNLFAFDRCSTGRLDSGRRSSAWRIGAPQH